MAGDRWQARIVTSEEPADGLWLGEIVFNSARNSLGVMGDVWTSWFPNIDIDTDALTLPAHWTMTGYAGRTKAVDCNWLSTSLQIRPLFTTKYDAFNRGPSGAYRSSYTPYEPIITFDTSSQSYKIGPDELVNKGAPNSLEHFAGDADFYNRTNVIERDATSLPQPNANGYLWKDEPTTEFYVETKPSPRINQIKGAKNKGNRNGTWNSSGRNVINFVVPANKAITPNAGRGIGYRSWVFVPDAERKRLTFSMIIYGREGLRFSTRIGQPGNYQIFTSQIPASGYLHAIFPYRPERLKEEHYGKPLVIDWFYNWHYAEGKFIPNTEQYADISSLQVFEDHYLNFRLNPAYYQQDHDRSMSNYYSRRGSRDIAYAARHNVIFPKPLLSDTYLASLSTPIPYTITDKNRFGFNVLFDVSPSTVFPLDFSYHTQVAGTLSR